MIITGGMKDRWSSSDFRLEQIVVLPKNRADEKIMMRKMLEHKDANIAKGFLLLLLDYNKTDVAYILQVSDSWIYRTMLPNIRKAYKEVNKDG